MSDRHLDLTGLKCPLPALRARKALRRLVSGDRLILTCTDPLAAIDIPNLLRETGDILESQASTGEVLTFEIRRCGPVEPPANDSAYGPGQSRA